MKTYALFDNQTASELLFEILPEKKMEIDVFAEDHSVKDSAEKGILAAYHIINNYDFPFNVGKYYIACEFAVDSSARSKIDLRRNVTGGSAGLAFGLKFVQELMELNGIKINEGSIAATGEITDHTSRARINAVNGIDKKIKAAMSVLNRNDWLLIPASNLNEINEKLIKQLDDKGIVLLPVSTVREVIEKYLDTHFRIKNGKLIDLNQILIKVKELFFKYKLFLITALILIVIVSLSLFFPRFDRIVEDLEWGEFTKAKFKTSVCSFLLNSKQNNMLKNWYEIDRSMGINFDYIRVNGNEDLNEPGASVRNLNLPTLLLDSDDKFRFFIKPSQDCYFYVFQLMGSDIYRLFPLSDFSISDNYLKSDSSYYLPSKEVYYILSNEDYHGEVVLFFLASPWKARDIENLYSLYEKIENGDKKFEYGNHLLQRIRHRNLAGSYGIHSVFYLQSSFLKE